MSATPKSIPTCPTCGDRLQDGTCQFCRRVEEVLGE